MLRSIPRTDLHQLPRWPQAKRSYYRGALRRPVRDFFSKPHFYFVTLIRIVSLSLSDPVEVKHFRDQAVFLVTNFSQYNLMMSGYLFPMFVAHEKPLTVGWLQWHLYSFLLFHGTPLGNEKEAKI